jgi:hypothetical protein
MRHARFLRILNHRSFVPGASLQLAAMTTMPTREQRNLVRAFQPEKQLLDVPCQFSLFVAVSE